MSNKCNNNYIVGGKGLVSKPLEPCQEIVVVQKEERHSKMIDNGDCTYTHISGSGQATLISADPNFAVVDNCDGIVTFAWKDHDPVDVNVCKIVGDNCNSALDFNPDGTITFTDNRGVSKTIPFPSSVLTENSNGTLTHISGDGIVSLIDICEIVSQHCTDSLTSNPDGSFVHRAVNGVVTVIPAPPVASLIDNGNGTYIFNNGLGDTTVIDTNA